jgi:hypothetical protein
MGKKQDWEPHIGEPARLSYGKKETVLITNIRRDSSGQVIYSAHRIGTKNQMEVYRNNLIEPILSEPEPC